MLATVGAGFRVIIFLLSAIMLSALLATLIQCDDEDKNATMKSKLQSIRCDSMQTMGLLHSVLDDSGVNGDYNYPVYGIKNVSTVEKERDKYVCAATVDHWKLKVKMRIMYETSLERGNVILRLLGELPAS